MRWTKTWIFGLFLPVASAEGQTALSVGTMRTQLEEAAVRLAVRASRNLGDLVDVHDATGRDVAVGWVLSPEISILTGESDALNGVVAKLTGNIYPHLRLANQGLDTDRDQNFLLIIPVSVGFEADRRFDRPSGLFEAGMVPFWKTGVNEDLDLTPGLFVQAGYKFSARSIGTPSVGGSADQSSEPTGQALFRVKATLGVDWRAVRFNGGTVAVRGRATVWLDVAHSDRYHRLEGTLSVPLSASQSFDLVYERGSGAPNFNRGDQFSANLTIQF